MNKKLAMSLTSIGLAVGIMGASTLAWFTSKDSTKANFEAGKIEVKVSPKSGAKGSVNLGKDLLPGATLKPEFLIKNTGTRAAYVRVKVEPKWQDELSTENIKLKEAIVNKDSKRDYEWIKGNDGWYYCQTPIFTYGDNELPMEFKLDKELTDNNYQGKNCEINYEVEAIQASNEAVYDAWEAFPTRN